MHRLGRIGLATAALSLLAPLAGTVAPPLGGILMAQPGCHSEAVVYNYETHKNECSGTGSTCTVCPHQQ